jgi:acyl-CoA thioesterase 8
MFTNTRPLWHPPGARGVFGGAVIAQCLSAAQKTVPSEYSIHSMHCYFVLAGNAEIPITYHVERVRDGRSFITRTVQARQRAKPIFTVTLSFQIMPKETDKTVHHEVSRPDIPIPSENDVVNSSGPFETLHRPMERSEQYYDMSSATLETNNIKDDTIKPHQKRVRMFVRVKGKISGGHEAHLTALAYMSDSFFIGTVARAHKLWRNFPPTPSKDNERIDMIHGTKDPREAKSSPDTKDALQIDEARPEIGMMVSLDHTIYFHNPRDFRADEWMLEEMSTPVSSLGTCVAESIRILTPCPVEW